MAANLSLTQFVTWARPVYLVYLMHHDESVLYTIDNMLFEDQVSYSIVRNLLRNLITE